MKQTKPTQKLVNKQTKRTMKHWVMVVLFGLLIFVFALWTPGRMGMGSGTDGGVAATVNDSPVLMAEFQQRAREMEARTRQQLAQIPEQMRKQFEDSPQFGPKAARAQALKSLVDEEIYYQAAQKRGIRVPDSEVRDSIISDFAFLKENGRFMKDRYQAFLQNQNMSTEEFESQVRRRLTLQKLQDLFTSATLSARAETKHDLDLKRQKVALRFVEIKNSDFSKPGFVTDEEVSKFLATNKAEVDGYYKANQVEFMTPESVKARHILVRVDAHRTDDQAAKMIADLKKQVTAKNFAEMATKNSEDPGSKANGGDLGEFQHGRMAKEFDMMAFSLTPGQVSAPVKTQFGYHLILVEKKTPSSIKALADAQTEIARKLYARNKESEVVAKTKALLKKGDKAEVDAFLKKSGLKWSETGEFDFSVAEIPKMPGAQGVLGEIVKHGKSTGLIGDLINAQGGYYIIDVASWKEVTPAAPAATDAVDRNVDYRMLGTVLNAWTTDIRAKANVQMNPNIAIE